jgi:hypothetical protein
VGPRAGLDAVERRKILFLAGNQTPTSQLIARRYTDSYKISKLIDFACILFFCSRMTPLLFYRKHGLHK